MPRKRIVIYALILVGVVSFGVISYDGPSSASSEPPSVLTKQKGVCWVGSREKITRTEIEKLKVCGVTWISQTPFGWQSAVDSPEIKFETSSEHIMWGESEEGITTTTQLADSFGIKVMLKPHIWTRGGWPGDINMKSEEDWQKWFSHYTEFILNYAALAENLKVKILCIGTELHHTTKREQDWRMLIKKIREVYHGKLTYAANFHEEFEHVKFWDDLDYIGIQGYFALSKQNNPDVEEMMDAWDVHLKKIEKTQRRYNKPVLFTEIGYRSTEDAAVEPWRWPGKDDYKFISDEAQANCYEAFFRKAWSKDWLEGAYFWKWYPHAKSRMMEVDFSPQGKKAEVVMSNWYNKN